MDRTHRSAEPVSSTNDSSRSFPSFTCTLYVLENNYQYKSIKSRGWDVYIHIKGISETSGTDASPPFGLVWPFHTVQRKFKHAGTMHLFARFFESILIVGNWCVWCRGCVHNSAQLCKHKHRYIHQRMEDPDLEHTRSFTTSDLPDVFLSNYTTRRNLSKIFVMS